MNNFSKVNYRKGDVSRAATRLLQEDFSKDYVISEIKALLSWVKTIYPEDYEIYIKDSTSEVNEENAVSFLKNVITMCTYNSF